MMLNYIKHSIKIDFQSFLKLSKSDYSTSLAMQLPKKTLHFAFLKIFRSILFTKYIIKDISESIITKINFIKKCASVTQSTLFINIKKECYFFTY